MKYFGRSTMVRVNKKALAPKREGLLLFLVF
jgi:hypothetical protein